MITEDQPARGDSFKDLDSLIAPDHPLRQVKARVDEILRHLDPQLEEIQARDNPAIQPRQVLKARVLQALYNLDDPHLFCQRAETDVLFWWFLDLNLNGGRFDPALFKKCQDLVLKQPAANLFFSEMAYLFDYRGWSSHASFQVDRKLIESWAVMKGYRPRLYTPRKVMVYLVIFLFLGSDCYWHCSRERSDFWHLFNIFSDARYGAYADLARSFVVGKICLSVEPDAKLALSKNPYDPAQRLPGTEITNDYSYYHGKYYLYFGPVPALLIDCPWYFATGYFPSQNLLAFVFCILNLVFFFCLTRSLISNYFYRVPLWMESAIYIMYGLANMLSFVAGRPDMYEVAIISSAAFTLGFFLFVLLAINGASSRWFWLMLASCSAGLAAGCRPMAVFLFCFLGLYWLYLHYRPKWSRVLIKETLAVFVPALLSISALLWYNYARFEDPFCFGVRYVLNGGDAYFTPNFELKNIPDGIWCYYLLPWRFDSIFPYVTMVSDLHLPWIYLPNRPREIYTGLFPSFPIIILGFFWPFYIFKFRAEKRRPLMIFGIMISIWALLLGLMISAFFATAARYELELLLPLLLMTTLALLARRHLGPLLLWQRLAFILLLLISCYIGIAHGLTAEDFWIQDILRSYHLAPM